MNGLKRLFVLIILPCFCLPFLSGCSGEVKEIEADDLVLLPWGGWRSYSAFGNFGIPILMRHSDDNATFTVTVEAGGIHLMYGKETQDKLKRIVVSYPGDTYDGDVAFYDSTGEYSDKYVMRAHGVEWWPNFELEVPPSITYVDIVARKGGHILGYAVVEIYSAVPYDPYCSDYYSRLLKAAVYPKVNGRYQSVAEERVAREIEKVKNG